MEHTGTDTAGDTLTAYDFAIEEVRVASSKLARALESGDGTTTKKECSYAWSVYEKMIDLYPRVRLDTTQRAPVVGLELFLRRPAAASAAWAVAKFIRLKRPGGNR